ncbi:unnamed protein product [Blepharisma stoltei]|uniref:Uncharacterized protein n=1 Tax=Blepharisma stoltei TaxID=1481888 RepID=A0AAU9IDN2_9CILI|nr:unnamed protein product [Blepharisma stoltei]
MLRFLPFQLMDIRISTRLNNLFSKLRFLCVIQGMLGFFQSIYSPVGGLCMLVSLLLLYTITVRKNWVLCVTYIFESITDIYTEWKLIEDFYFTEESKHYFIPGVSFVKIFFHIIAIYIVFLTYRELKALHIELIWGNRIQFN